jgi:glycerol-3-phosphate O-acyltransferase/dihydroxyacetone phosphate acyltransferase
MRRTLEMLVRWLAEALIRLYYPHRAVQGADRIPAGRPVVFVANHPNGLLDPLLLRVATGRPARFLAKSTLFGNPIARLAMTSFGSIPVYRAHESGARGTDTSRNEESFALCRAALAQGEALALFPEGASHSDPQLRPLKTGAARIALSAEAEQDGRLDLTVVPIGLYYERKVLFRSRVLLVVGEPLRVAPLLPGYRADQRASVDALTDDIRARLDEVVLQAESRELLAGVARVARWTGPPGTTPEGQGQGQGQGDDNGDGDARSGDLAAQHRYARELLGAYGRLRARDPERVEAIAAQARAYERVLRHLGVRDPWALEVELVSPLTAALTVLRLLVSFPVAIAGAVLGYLPYRLAGEVAKRTTKDDDVLGTVKMLAGALFLWLAWSGEAIAAGVCWGARWIAPVFLFAVASGYVALRFDELRGETGEALRHLWLRLRHRHTARELAAHRRALAEAVTAALRDAR